VEEQNIHVLPYFLKMLIIVQIKTPEVNQQCQGGKGVQETEEHSFHQVVVGFHKVLSTVMVQFLLIALEQNFQFNRCTSIPQIYIFLHRRKSQLFHILKNGIHLNTSVFRYSQHLTPLLPTISVSHIIHH
jgi:hypothetical protein